MKKRQNHSTENLTEEEKKWINRIKELRMPIKKNLVKGMVIIGKIRTQKRLSDRFKDKELARGIYMTLIMGTEDIYKSVYGYVPEKFKERKNFSVKIRFDIRIALIFMLGWILETALGKKEAKKFMNYIHDFWFEDLKKDSSIIKVSEFLLNPEEKTAFLEHISATANKELQDCNTDTQTIARLVSNKRMLKYVLLWNNYFNKGLGPIVNISIQLCKDIFNQDPTIGTNNLLIYDSMQAVGLSTCFRKTAEVIKSLMR